MDWILSLVGIAFLGVMIDIVAPSGNISKFIKSIFAIFILFVLVSPLQNLVKNGIGKFEFVSNKDLNQDEEFLIKYNQNLAIYYAVRLTQTLVNSGFKGIVVTILPSLTDLNFNILEIQIDKSKLVLTDEIKNININEKIKEIIDNEFGKKMEVKFYE